nr:MAG TPA: hypothetical protein [Caudoviricetes sp.]
MFRIFKISHRLCSPFNFWIFFMIQIYQIHFVNSISFFDKIYF